MLANTGDVIGDGGKILNKIRQCIYNKYKLTKINKFNKRNNFF